MRVIRFQTLRRCLVLSSWALCVLWGLAACDPVETAASDVAGGDLAQVDGDLSEPAEVSGELSPSSAELAGYEEYLSSLPCPTPRAPALAITHGGAALVFQGPEGAALQTAWAEGDEASEPETWTDGDTLQLPDDALPRVVTIFARVVDEACTSEHWFAHVTELRAAYPPAPGSPGTTAIPIDSPLIAGWASAHLQPLAWGADLTPEWQDPEQALGPASGDAAEVCSLGNGGYATLGFDLVVADHEGPDLAVFENALSDSFLELAWVEVSSDGEHWLRFDSAYLGGEPVSAYGGHDLGLIGGLAGRYRGGFGVPFDLASLNNRAAVREGLVDLQAITAVRVVDVVGDGQALDSFGATIYDPHKTVESAGFDLDGVAVLRPQG